MSFVHLCNTCWMASCYGEARRYHRDTKNQAAVQAALLNEIVQGNRDTAFGRKYGFASIRNVRDFQRGVPLSTYEDYREQVERIGSGERQVLTSDPVKLLEPTGGSTSGEKLIPYTSSLHRGFGRAIRVWIWDLYRGRPAVRRGSSYWSISPLSHVGRKTKAGIPIGFSNDASYLSRWERPLVQAAMAVSPEVALCPSIAAARYATLFFLLRAPELSLISVWNPTFLTELLSVLWEHRERLADDVSAGRISVGPAEQSPVSQRAYPPALRRGDELRGIFRRASQVSECLHAIWPSLAMVSCWADGPASVHVNKLRQSLPGVEIEPKGLLATEAFVTIPLLDHPAPALAIRSHFFEFQAVEAPGAGLDSETLLAGELLAGRQYRVIVTNGGGLYRYQLRDVVEVAGFKDRTPLLRFVGKTDEISDLVGEKLNAAHVQSVIDESFRQFNLVPTYSQLRPSESSKAGYVLTVAAPALAENEPLQRRLCQTIEKRLEANPGYHYAREIGQLSPLSLEVIDEQTAEARTAKRISERVACGQRLGDIKPSTFDRT